MTTHDVERTASGDWTVTDRETGITRTFTTEQDARTYYREVTI